MKMTTINYYEKNANEFYNNSINANMVEVTDKFLKFIEPGGAILDAGCGSGRDAFYFLNHGYAVEAFDLSPSLAAMASALTGIDVQVIGFLDLDKEDKYNGIWACASLLHLEGREIGPAIKKLITALKPDGVLYASFKYGEASGERNGRYFTDMTEDKLVRILQEFPDIDILELWQSEDVRPEKKGELWLNIFLRKQI
jgi:SAM-dependent methyltransferase